MNCKLEYHCGRCIGNHGGDECKIPKNCTDKRRLYCVNCEETDHAAPYLNFVSDAKQLLNGMKRAERGVRFKKTRSQISQGPVPNTRPAGGFSRPAAVTTAQATRWQEPLR